MTSDARAYIMKNRQEASSKVTLRMDAGGTDAIPMTSANNHDPAVAGSSDNLRGLEILLVRIPGLSEKR